MKCAVIWIAVLTASLTMCGCSSDPADSQVTAVEIFSQSYRPRDSERVSPASWRGVSHSGVPAFSKPMLQKDEVLQDTLGLSREGINALLFLKYTSLFATYPRIGLYGQFPPQIVAFQQLLLEPNAGAAFSHLVECGSCGCPAGQLYGLCGLYFNDPPRFRIEVERLRNSAGEVFVMEESSARFVAAGELVLSESPLAVRLSSPNVRLWSWYAGGIDSIRPAPPDTDALPILDIAGGGYPCFLRDIRAPVTMAPDTASGAELHPSPAGASEAFFAVAPLASL